MTRSVGWAIWLGLLVFLWQLPVAPELQAADSVDALEDFDFVQAAETAWNKDETSTALAMLDAAVDLDPANEYVASELRSSWKRELEKKKSLLGKSWNVVSGFLTGKAHSIEGFVGAGAGDLMVWGDMRDLTVELLSDDTDPFIVTLASAGIVASGATAVTGGGAFPSQGVLSLLKVLRKLGALSRPFVRHVTTLAKAARTVGWKAIAPLVDSVAKLWRRSGQYGPRFARFMRYVDDSRHIRLLNSILKAGPSVARKLEQVLLVAGRGSKKLAQRSLAYATKYGEKGLDLLRKAARKGPEGLRRMLDNPVKTTRMLKNVRKGQVFVFHGVNDWWHSRLVRFGSWLELARFAGLVLLFLFLFLRLQFHRLLPRRFLDMPRLRRWGLAGGATLILALAVFASRVTATAPDPVVADAGAHLVRLAGMEIAGERGKVNEMSVAYWFWFVIILLFTMAGQVLAHWVARGRLKSVVDDYGENPRLALQQLEANGIYFELPLYIGLAGTVLAFLVVTIGGVLGQVAAPLAYFSTLSGIGAYVFFQVRFVVRERSDWIKRLAAAEDGAEVEDAGSEAME